MLAIGGFSVANMNRDIISARNANDVIGAIEALYDSANSSDHNGLPGTMNYIPFSFKEDFPRTYRALNEVLRSSRLSPRDTGLLIVSEGPLYEGQAHKWPVIGLMRCESEGGSNLDFNKEFNDIKPEIESLTKSR